MTIRFFIILFLALSSFSGFAQRAKISGIVTDSDGIPIQLASIHVSGTANGAFTDEKGKYSLTVSTGDSCSLVFSCLGYNKTQRIIPEVSGDMTVNVKMRITSYELETATITRSRVRTNTMEQINLEQGRLAVDATGGSIESFVITGGKGVSSTNELSTQYSVRGGNYNENIVYVNGIEVYRPILIRSGQQEGLSFINPDLTGKVEFSSGGFDARYGDKMSSVLDVTYKKPEKLEGGVAGSMLGGNVYLGSASGKFTQITGFRYKRGTTLLNTLDTRGDYNPSAMDMQTYMTYTFTPKLDLSFMGNYSDNTYDFNPETRKTSFGTLDEVRNFDVYYNGSSERDRFRTLFGAASLKYVIAEHADIALQVSAFQSTEQEKYDIDGEYWLSNVMGDDKEITGTGRFIEHARNYLKANVANLALTGNIGLNQHTLRWSLTYQKENVKDRIREWELQDSMGYSLPYNEDVLRVNSNLFSRNDIASNRFSGYLQDTYKFRINEGLFSLTAGVRGSYWDFSDEFIVSPRASLGFIPSRNQNFTFRLASGIYYQAPFYKEFRVINKDEEGNQYVTLNEDIKSQRSIHFVLGGDYDFKFAGDRPFKFTTELYYKKLDNLIPYTVNNVRIQYYGDNISNGYTRGIDLKLFGQFVSGTDSWINFSLMEAKQYIEKKKVPMPTDQLYNFTLYFTDYMPNYKRIQGNLRLIWADGIPFSVPGNEYKNGIRTPAYRRVDLGLTYRLLGEDDIQYNSFWRNFKNIWIGLDAFNILDIKNVSSYSWFSDVNRERHAVPDKLTGRQFNIKLIAEF
jgi:hypothetical protein